MPSVSVKDVNQQAFTKAFAEFLKKSGKVKVPEWTDLIKTGRHKELSPYDQDWFYTRVSAVARHIYLRSPVGVGSVQKIFGSRQRRGTRPSHFCESSGSVARKALQTLENLKLVEKNPNGGRQLTSQGHRDLDRIAAQIKASTRQASLITAPVAAAPAAAPPAAAAPAEAAPAPAAPVPATA